MCMTDTVLSGEYGSAILSSLTDDVSLSFASSVVVVSSSVGLWWCSSGRRQRLGEQETTVTMTMTIHSSCAHSRGHTSPPNE
jgi:hypothetical protein